MPRPLVPDRRGRILTAARDLTLEHGWPHTTIAQIAQRAGIGKGAVYREFDDKTAILAAVLNRSMRDLTTQVHQRVLDAAEVIDLPTVYRFGVEALLSDPLMRALYLGDDTVLGDHVHGVTDQRYPARFGWLTDYIGRLQAAGVVDAAVSTETIARLLSVFTIGLINSPGILDSADPQVLLDTVGLFADLVGKGLATEQDIDVTAARQAQLALLEQLSTQLDLLEETT
ncbi:TetR family transcriptional regulator [Stackebrandtia endophytica]|uniref:TetR family transcriptional regulator n=1 Tax=Stackebrandtia endophytica TaxID=1496996 RepID=A0A543B0M6_9ACTN|nr:TetR/AcrR family transcriptional regulator [Stackebrandtia endophytica]TQL78391.1 TetR family transcriptional regulator [Stackebrandtia endophytica]